MSEIMNFPGAQRAGAYVETEDLPDVPARIPVEPESEVAEDEAIVEPILEPITEVPAKPVTAKSVSKAAVAPTKSVAKETAVPASPAEPEEDQEPPVPAAEGFRGFINQVTGGAMKLAPSAAEAAKRTTATIQEGHEALIRQSTWTRGVGVLIANKKGTSGKTPCSILVGGVLAAIRGGSVAILEYSDDKGQLAYRSEGKPQLGMGELVENIGHVRTQSQLRGYTVTQTSFASVIGSTPKWRPALTRQNVLDVAALVDEHYTIRLMDTGNVYSSGPFGAAVEASDVLVIPTMVAQDAVSEALELLEYLEHQGPDASRLARTAMVVMMSDGRPEIKGARLKQQFIDKGIAEDHIFAVPYDAHVAERGALTLDKLAPATRQAFTAVAAGLVRQLNSNVFDKDEHKKITEGKK